MARARARGLITILDGKRNDIASTASAYADAALAGVTFVGQRFPVWEVDSAGAQLDNSQVRGWASLPVHLPPA